MQNMTESDDVPLQRPIALTDEIEKLYRSWQEFDKTNAGQMQTNEGKANRRMLKQLAELFYLGRVKTKLGGEN
jgi:hypothetical protein